MKVINTGGKFFQFSFCWNAAGTRKIRPHPFCEASCQFSSCILFAFQMVHHAPSSVPSLSDVPPWPPVAPLHMTLLITNGPLMLRPLNVGQPPWVLMNSEQQDLLVLQCSTYSDLYRFTNKTKMKTKPKNPPTSHRASYNVLVSRFEGMSGSQNTI